MPSPCIRSESCFFSLSQDQSKAGGTGHSSDWCPQAIQLVGKGASLSLGQLPSCLASLSYQESLRLSPGALGSAADLTTTGPWGATVGRRENEGLFHPSSLPPPKKKMPPERGSFPLRDTGVTCVTCHTHTQTDRLWKHQRSKRM